MGKKSGRSGERSTAAATTFMLKVAMHCNCKGCINKIGSAVKDLALHPGVEAMDQSAVESKGEVMLVAAADPEKLRQRLRKATGKKVDLFLPRQAKAEATAKKEDDIAANVNAAQALLARLSQGAWAANQLPQLGGGWNAGSYGAAQAYPWAAAASSPYVYPAATAAAWGQYAYPPAAQGQGHGAYYGGAPAWHTHGQGY